MTTMLFCNCSKYSNELTDCITPIRKGKKGFLSPEAFLKHMKSEHYMDKESAIELLKEYVENPLVYAYLYPKKFKSVGKVSAEDSGSEEDSDSEEEPDPIAKWIENSSEEEPMDNDDDGDAAIIERINILESSLNELRLMVSTKKKLVASNDEMSALSKGSTKKKLVVSNDEISALSNGSVSTPKRTKKAAVSGIKATKADTKDKKDKKGK